METGAIPPKSELEEVDLFGLRAAEVSKLAGDTIFATKANDGKKHGKMLLMMVMI